MGKVQKSVEINYNRAKMWQIGCFAMNNSATNMYMILMNYVSYYANGIAGFGIAFVSTLLTAMRIFDGITDPIIGWFIDKTDGKFGKFRPFMIIGNIILAGSVCLIFFCTHLVPQGFLRTLFFIGVYALYIIGYTFQTAVTKAGQTVLTNDPKQRPIFTMFDMIGMMVFMIGATMYVTSTLVPKYGTMYDIGLYKELVPLMIGISVILTIIAIIGIWKKDRREFFGTGHKRPKIGVKDYIDVIKHNRAIQMLIIAASTDKLAMQVAMNTTLMIMLYGIMIGNYGMSAKVSPIAMIISIVFIFVGVAFARKKGQKRVLQIGSVGAIVCFVLIAILLLTADTKTINIDNFSINTALFLIFYCVGNGFYMIAGNIVIPMIADCSDYETYRSGRYVPGMMGTLFSFVDKLVSSLAASIVGFSVMFIGFKDKLPDVTDTLTPELKTLVVIMFCGLPILAWIISLIAMKFYPLNGKKMEEIQEKIAELKAKEDAA